ncbi:hypothetical protein LV779_08600 [Streptomyces thinghirensis]|nr:hypothetical protein [Streptomyces thinghirensis]
MNELRDRVDAVVRDLGATAEKLKPWYRYMCKRPTLGDHYPPDLQPPQRHPRRQSPTGHGAGADHRPRRRDRGEESRSTA